MDSKNPIRNLFEGFSSLDDANAESRDIVEDKGMIVGRPSGYKSAFDSLMDFGSKLLVCGGLKWTGKDIASQCRQVIVGWPLPLFTDGPLPFHIANAFIICDTDRICNRVDDASEFEDEGRGSVTSSPGNRLQGVHITVAVVDDNVYIDLAGISSSTEEWNEWFKQSAWEIRIVRDELLNEVP